MHRPGQNTTARRRVPYAFRLPKMPRATAVAHIDDAADDHDNVTQWISDGDSGDNNGDGHDAMLPVDRSLPSSRHVERRLT